MTAQAWEPGDPLWPRPSTVADGYIRAMFELVCEEEVAEQSFMYWHINDGYLRCLQCRVSWYDSEGEEPCWVCGKPGEK